MMHHCFDSSDACIGCSAASACLPAPSSNSSYQPCFIKTSPKVFLEAVDCRGDGRGWTRAGSFAGHRGGSGCADARAPIKQLHACRMAKSHERMTRTGPQWNFSTNPKHARSPRIHRSGSCGPPFKKPDLLGP
eukprot:scaffold1913_cov257-Pinguiococcus_pyrenoidosus.AAC.9